MTTPASQPPHPGQEIRRAREQYGWSQPELARRARIGVRTLRRLEAGEGSPDTRTLVRLRHALGLSGPEPALDPIAVLRSLSTADFLAELARRLIEADRILERGRTVEVGDPPPGLAGRPGILRGPDTRPEPDGDGEHT